MRKKFLGAFMLGLLALGTAGTITSCKDYDGDISALKNDVSTLQSDLAKAEASLTELKKELADQDATIEALANFTNTIQNNLDDEIKRAKAAEAALEARIKATEDAIEEIKTLLASKVDQDEYDKKMADIDATLEALGLADQKEATTREAADKALQIQIDALNRLASVLGDTTDEQVAKLQELLAQVNTNTNDIATINKTLSSINDQITDILAEINTLNLLYKGSLRSLVFRPDLYYWGVEATKLLALDCKTWATEETAYNHVESVFNNEHPYYKSTQTFRILDFTATYHMNPSSSDPKEFVNVDVNTDDKDFYTDGTHTTRAIHNADCGLYVADWTTGDQTISASEFNNGLLKVKLGVQDKSKIKQVPNDSQITVFATEVTVGRGEKGDTTITSDYATLVKDEAKALYLWHKTGKDVPTTGVVNTHTTDPVYFQCTECTATEKGLNHLFGNPYEAGIDFLPQDTCNWNSTLDLRKLVGTHYVDENGVEKEFDVEQYGLKYVFELTGLYLDANKTSESAHAAINPEDGYTFRPQMPNYDKDNVGTQQPYGYAQNIQTVGRTPLVRVSLVDATTGDVYAYGYIRIKITLPAEEQEAAQNRDIEYQGADWTWNNTCEYPGWSYETKWIQTEYDLYNMLGLTRTQFEDMYEPELNADDSFVQYTQKSVGTANTIYNPETDQNTTYYVGGDFAKAQKEYGKVITIVDASVTEDGTRTSIIKWNMTGAQAKQYFIDENKSNITVAVKYVSNSKPAYPDVYVVMKTGDKKINKASAVAEWDAAKINNYWYATDNSTAKTGLDEIHANTITPEDADYNSKTIAEFTDMFSDVFYGNLASTPSTMAEILNITDPTPNGEFAVDKLTIDFVFSSKNVGKQFTVKDIVNGQTVATRVYKMSVSNDGKELWATCGTVKDTVAVIDGDEGDYKAQKIRLCETEFAKDLLNYKSHNDLVDAIYAVIGLKAVNKCPFDLPIAENTFNVRFLRPLNMISADKEIEDANITKVQQIYMKDLVLFNDWRDAWDSEDDTWGPYNYDKLVGNPIKYSLYYGIKSITIDGVEDGHNVAECPYAITNLGQKDADTWVTLASVSDQLEFVYEEPNSQLRTHRLTYTNLSSTLSECTVKVPVTVEYYWGKLKATAAIKIYGSHHNAAKK